MQKSDKIFVTGGTGLLGRFVLLQLQEEGFTNLHAIYRSKTSIQSLPTPLQKIHWHNCDILDPVGLESKMKGAQWVFHCAAQVSFDPRDMKDLINTNIQGTQLVSETAKILSVKRFCHVSSVAAIGRDKHNKLIDEKTIWSAENASWYAKSKHAAEQEIWRAHYEGLDVVVVNPSIILGPARWLTGSSKIFWQIWKGLRFFAVGTNGFVDVRDVAKFMVMAMQKPETSGQRYILNADNIKYKELFTKIANLMGKKPPTIAVNGLIRFLSWRLEYIKSLLTNSRPLITRETAHTSTLTIQYNNTKSLQIPGFEYRSLDQTLEDNVRFFMKDLEAGKIKA